MVPNFCDWTTNFYEIDRLSAQFLFELADSIMFLKLYFFDDD